jgi:SAM-dependent methyltransferase
VPKEFEEPRVGFEKPVSTIGKSILSPTTRFYLRTVQKCLRVQFAYLRRTEFLKALRGFKVYLNILANLISTLRLLPKRRYCEFCGWSGFSFVAIYYVDRYRADVFCPCCRLMDRYRTLVHFVRESEWGARIRELRPRVLDVAPTESSRKMLATEFKARDSVGFDISNPWAEVVGDLQDICFPDESFDLFLCYEVLDYIPRDDVALTELRRVLKRGGYGILRVGFSQEIQTTIEYSKPDADDSYHIRRYGQDLPDRFRTAGFEVELVHLTQSVSERERERLGLDTVPVFLLRRPAH